MAHAERIIVGLTYGVRIPCSSRGGRRKAGVAATWDCVHTCKTDWASSSCRSNSSSVDIHRGLYRGLFAKTTARSYVSTGKTLLITHWLVFLFLQGFEKTGLGERVATLFVKAFGKSTLGLAYGLAFAEGLIAPAMPSTTARAGGIFMPIMKSLSETSGSLPGELPFVIATAFCTSRLCMSMTYAKQAINWKAVRPKTVRMQLQAYMLT